MTESKRRKLLFIFLNLFLGLTGSIAVIVTLFYGSRATRLDGLVTEYWQNIVTFTLLSNIFLSIIALISAIIGIVKYKTGQPLPRALATWYLVAASAGMLTCLTVLFFLAPMRVANGKNYFDMLLEPMFFLHFLNPILSAVTFVLFFSNAKISFRGRLLAVLPIAIYAIPYAICVVILGIWPDFYGITFGGRYYLTPLVFAVFCFVLFGIASLLSFFHNKRISK